MSTSDSAEGRPSNAALLDIAHAANESIKSGRQNGTPPSEFDFTAQLSFLLTIGYLTREQAGVLLQWFQSAGALKLPDLPGPESAPQPRMYELITTRIHFPPRVSATGPENFFDDLAHAVTSLVTDVLDGVTEVLDAATSTLQAAGALVHEVHDLVVLAE